MLHAAMVSLKDITCAFMLVEKAKETMKMIYKCLALTKGVFRGQSYGKRSENLMKDLKDTRKKEEGALIKLLLNDPDPIIGLYHLCYLQHVCGQMLFYRCTSCIYNYIAGL